MKSPIAYTTMQAKSQSNMVMGNRAWGAQRVQI